jgi:hypothetical protein
MGTREVQKINKIRLLRSFGGTGIEKPDLGAFGKKR